MKARPIAACVVLLAGCGYPDFAFDGDGGAIDSTIEDVASEAPTDTAAEARVDAAEASTDVAMDTETAPPIDSAADTPIVVDSGVDAPDSTDPCLVLDDMEDGDGLILHICGRSGTWYTYNDGTSGGTQTPAAGKLANPELIPGGRDASTYAEHTFGSGFTSWGAGIGFNFIDGGPSYDAHTWSGVSFWARSPTDKAYPRLALADVDTDARGGVCSGATCGDHWGLGLVIGTTWGFYTVKFSDLKQEGWGYLAPAFDATHVYGVQWQLPASTTFDLWIDDVAWTP